MVEESVGNNFERGVNQYLASQQFFISIIIFIYATSFSGTRVYTQL